MKVELKERQRQYEDSFTEFKPDSASNSEIRKTLVAFANSLPPDRVGGLFIGVADDGETINGVANPDGWQKKLRQICGFECYPPIVTKSVEVIEIEGKAVIEVQVPSSISRPHFAGPAFVRIGSESVKASEQLFEEFINSRHTLCGAILRLKGKVVTVRAQDKKLGSTAEPIRQQRLEYECVVVDCTPHVVRLSDLGPGPSEHYAEPLENVTLSEDIARRRPMLIVRPAR